MPFTAYAAVTSTYLDCVEVEMQNYCDVLVLEPQALAHRVTLPEASAACTCKWTLNWARDQAFLRPMPH